MKYLLHLVFVFNQFCIQASDFLVNRFSSTVHIGDAVSEVWGRFLWLSTSKEPVHFVCKHDIACEHISYSTIPPDLLIRMLYMQLQHPSMQFCLYHFQKHRPNPNLLVKAIFMVASIAMVDLGKILEFLGRCKKKRLRTFDLKCWRRIS